MRLCQVAAGSVIAGLVILALWRRLQDPLSTPVIPAEDPFTHMALVRGHLLDGSLDALYEGGRLYPPGMHAILAAVWVYTGLPLDALFRFGPAVFGAIGVLGVGALLWRCHGAVAAIVGALALALAPEAIFRTTMMSPTAVDVAVLPFLLLAIVETAQGRKAYGGVVIALATFLVLSHPWLLAILAPVVFALVVGLFLLGGARDTPHGVGAAIVLGSLAVALLAAVSSCWSQCSLGGRTSPRDLIDLLAVVGAALAIFAATCAALLRRQLAKLHGRRLHWGFRLALAAALAAMLYWGSLPAFRAGLPEHVDLPHMIGWPLLAFATAGLLLVPFTGNRAGVAGAALAAVTYPFVIYNPFDSPFWPHRTAIYLAIAAAILAGVAIGTIARVASAALHAGLARMAQPRHAVRWAPAAAMVVLLLSAGHVYADTPDSYDWYRLYPECQHDALQEIARDAPDDAIIITGDWRPKLVIAAYAHDGRNVWFTTGFYAKADERNASLRDMAKWADHVIVVVDPHSVREHPRWDFGFVEEPQFEPVHQDCFNRHGEPRIAAYLFVPDNMPPKGRAQPAPDDAGTGHNGTASGGNATEPGGNSTQPGGNATEPGGNSTQPGGNATQAGNGTSPGAGRTGVGGDRTTSGVQPAGGGTGPSGPPPGEMSEPTVQRASQPPSSRQTRPLGDQSSPDDAHTQETIR